MTRFDSQTKDLFIQFVESKGYSKLEVVSILKEIEYLIDAGCYDIAYERYLNPLTE